ncbi:hypothetical protein ES705_06232 [subsurface metagenome]
MYASSSDLLYQEKKIKDIWREIQKNNLDYVSKLDESEIFDRKRQFSEAKSVEKLLVAFSNTFGGIIAFGIDDQKSIFELDRDHRDKIDNQVINLNRKLQPPTSLLTHVIKTRNDNGCFFVFVQRNRGILSKTHNGITYKREGRNCVEMTDEEIELFNRIEKESLLDLDQFKKRAENSKMLTHYKRFFGREIELMKLHDFLNSNQKTAVVVGKGGVGKTRLLIEFAQEIAKNKSWDVKFIHPYLEFKRILSKKNLVLFVDEAMNYEHVERVVDYVFHGSFNKKQKIKLILASRSIFEKSLTSLIQRISYPGKGIEKFYLTETQPFLLRVLKSKIKDFIKHYYSIPSGIVDFIVKESNNSFSWAIVLSEFFMFEQKKGSVEDILKWKTSKYSLDLSKKIQTTLEDVEYTIKIVSLLNPIIWENDKHILKSLPNGEILINILSQSFQIDSDLLTVIKDKEYTYIFIKPDILSDFYRLNFISENYENFRYFWTRNVARMGFRISRNVSLLLRSKGGINENIENVLSEIWKTINTEKGESIEYFDSLLFFLQEMNEFSFINTTSINKQIWKSSYVIVKKEDERAHYSYTKVLASLSKLYIKTKNIQEMSNCLNEVRELRVFDEKIERSEVAILVNISLCCSSENNLSILERIMTELKEIIRVSHARELILDYSTAIINAVHHFGKNKKKEKMMGLLKELKEIKNLNNDKEFRTKYGNGLINATTFYGEFEDYDAVEYCLAEIRQMNKDYPEKTLRVILGKATVNAILNYGKNKKYDKMTYLVDELRISYMDFHDKDSAIFYANGLNNSITYFSESSILRDMENIMLEIQTIVRDFNIIEIHREFAKSLISFIRFCFEKKSTKNFDIYLSILEKMIEENRDIEILTSLAKSLFNTISLKGELKEFSKLRIYLKKLEFLYENNKTKEIFIWLANAYQSSISQYCKEEKLKQVRHIKRKFKKIFEKNTINLQVRIEYGKCLYNLQNSFGEKRQFGDMKKIKNEIFELCTAFTHEGILELKAKSSFTTLVHLSQNNQPLSFSDILVSFNTRHHLPKEEGQNKDIQQIEQNFIKEIISKIKDIGNNPEEMAHFISWLSSQIKNVIDKFQVRESVISMLDDETKTLVSKSWLLY